MVEVERLPQQRLLVEQFDLREQNNAYGSLVTELKSLQNRLAELNSTSIFGSRQVSVANETVASASVATDALQGAYTFSFSQLANASRLLGSTGPAGFGVSQPLHDTDVVLDAGDPNTGPILSDAGFYPPVTSGTVTINGFQITIDPSRSLKELFQDISDQTGGAIEASYDTETDRITLSRVGGGAIILGSATDTSNFLQSAKLYNSPTGEGPLISAGAVGSTRVNVALDSANLATAIDTGLDGGGQPNATGTFSINGVDITFSMTDTLSDVLKRINDSDAGVFASYDAIQDRFVLASKATGDIGIAAQDQQGNFLSALGLSDATLERGRDALFSVNGGGTQRSRSNTITGDISGITGLTVTALQEGASTTVTVNSDTAKVRQAIEAFVEQYNKVQSMIDSQTAVNIDKSGKVTAATLSNQSEVDEIASRLRGTMFAPVSGLTGTINQLEKLGYTTSGDNNSLRLEDPEKLDAALANDLDDVLEFFTNDTNGLAATLDAYLEKLVGEDGSLIDKQSRLTQQATAIDTQIADLERLVQSNRERMVASFVAMETAQAQINQQLQFLQQRFANTT